jgi:alkyl sulfatase BDS1-like metallo-beta-lactamase superfamily hydrolase
MKGAFRNSLIMALAAIVMGCQEKPAHTPQGPRAKVPEILSSHCSQAIGEPRIERISERVWVALGFDLANVALIRTEIGDIVVDTAMSTSRAQEIRSAFEKEIPQLSVHSIIYTHSHIDHVGGASVWAKDETEIWATESFSQHLLKQYALFREAESTRGSMQFGFRVDPESLPCSSIGRRPQLKDLERVGILFPTHTFSGKRGLQFGSTELHLLEAPGETHDQLMVWLPKERVLLCGDNFYWTFPNLYTLRGTSPRPVDQWIKSIDLMRRLLPVHLVPGHTSPIHGEEKIQEVLRNYRDAIQWVRDEVVRRANRGEKLEEIAARVELPQHLRENPYIRELYGQVDWSARAIYTNNLGWFDGNPANLYPVAPETVARRELELMGGVERVMGLAEKALEDSDPKWAIHLLAKIEQSGLAGGEAKRRVRDLLAASFQSLAETISNTNGRAYLLESALDIKEGKGERVRSIPDPRFVERLPLDHILEIMAVNLVPERGANTHECLEFFFPDEGKRFFLTVRFGIAELSQGEPFPGTPEPVATLEMDSKDFKYMLSRLESALGLFLRGKIKVHGSWLRAASFLRMFRIE